MATRPPASALRSILAPVLACALLACADSAPPPASHPPTPAHDAPNWAPGARAWVTSGGPSHLGLAWDPTPKEARVDHYEVRHAGRVLRRTRGTSTVLSLLRPNTAYTFGIVAVDRQGRTSPASLTLQAKTSPGAPSRPAGRAPTRGASGPPGAGEGSQP